MGKDFIGEEATGVFVGELLEDMIETVARTKKLYCDVYIPQFFAKDYGHPLTYVPLWAMSLPLRKGDKVLVEFHQNDLTLPVLYKNDSEIDEQFFEKFEFGDFVQNGNIDKPEAVDTVGATWIGKDSYIIKTDDYTVFHQNNGFLLLDKDDNIYVYGKDVNVVATNNAKIDVGGDSQVYCKGDFTGKIDGDSNCTIKGDVTISSNKNIKLSSDSNTTIEVKGNAEVKCTGAASSVSITTGTGGFTVNNHLKVTK